MKRKVLLVAIFLLIYCASYASENSIYVVTERGKTVEITEMKAGYKKVTFEGVETIIGHDSHGNPMRHTEKEKSEFIETLSIPFNTRDGFGFQFRLPTIQEGDELIIKIVAEFPRPIKIQNQMKDFVGGKYNYFPKDSKKLQQLCWEFRKDDPVYNIPGNWTLTLFNKDRQLIKKVFDVR